MIVGESEAVQQLASIKDLRSESEQQTVPWPMLGKELGQRLTAK